MPTFELGGSRFCAVPLELLLPFRRQFSILPALHQVQHKRAIFAMDRNPAIARYIADDGIPFYRVAAFGYAGHQVVDSAHGDFCF